MCLIIHKPKGVQIQPDLLYSACQYNPHGYGLMALSGPQKIRVYRRSHTHFDDLYKSYLQVKNYECVIHLRLRTRGNITQSNTHPFRLSDSIYMAHNGTLDVHCRLPGRSDSWHMAHDYLVPLVGQNTRILYDDAFQRKLATDIGPNNRMVFMDAQHRETIIINKQFGVEYQGLWLSNTKWFDAARFGLAINDHSSQYQTFSGIKRPKPIRSISVPNISHTVRKVVCKRHAA